MQTAVDLDRMGCLLHTEHCHLAQYSTFSQEEDQFALQFLIEDRSFQDGYLIYHVVQRGNWESCSVALRPYASQR
jgi:phage head maturation protease